MKNLLATTAILAVLTTAASANNFEADSFSQPAGAVSLTVTNPLANGGNPISAGEINLHQNIPAQDLLVWCLDLQDLLFVPYNFTETTYTGGNLPGLPNGGLDVGQRRQIASLMFRGLSLAAGTSADDDAATQLAIWRVEYGTTFSSSASGALLAQMNLELADFLGVGGILDCPGCSLTVLSDAVNAPNQALGFASVAVPGPIAGAGLPGLLAAFLGLIGFGRLRRRNSIQVS